MPVKRMMNVENVMQGKTCVVTGATNGIGEATALGLAQKGARVIGIGRSRTKCAEVSERIKRLSGNPQVDFLIADLSVQEQVRQLAETIHRHCTQLDVLVNNAGASSDAPGKRRRHRDDLGAESFELLPAH